MALSLALAGCGGSAAKQVGAAGDEEVIDSNQSNTDASGAPSSKNRISAAGGDAGNVPDVDSPRGLTQGAERDGAAPDVCARGGSSSPIRLAYTIADQTDNTYIVGGNPQQENDKSRRVMTALVKWANANRGVCGRKIASKEYLVSQTATPEEKEAVCVRMTEDDDQQVVLDSSLFTQESLYSCFARHHVDFLGLITATDNEFLQKWKPYVSSTWPALDHQMTTMPSALKAVGYFSGGKVGIVLDDDPTVRRDYERYMRPALARVGVTPAVAPRYITQDPTNQQQAQATSAVLAFQQAGINRVISMNFALSFLAFSTAAEGQGYRPRYAFNDYWNEIVVNTFLAPEGQLAGAVGVSTSNTSILDNAGRTYREEQTPWDRKTLTPGQNQCLTLLSTLLRADMYKPGTSGESANPFPYCNYFLLWLKAARNVGAAWNPGNLGRGLKALGKSFSSALQVSTNFGTGRLDGASSAATGRYNRTCDCFVRFTAWKQMS